MFSSKLLASLAEAGHEVELIGGEGALRNRLSPPQGEGVDVLIADLTDERFDGSAMLDSLRAENLLGSTRTLAFFSHVETSVRERAQESGFDLIVPRSRMAREATAVLSSLTPG